MVVAVALLAMLTWAMVYSSNPEPVAQGKPLSYWLAQLDQGTNWDQKPRDEAESAVRQIGTNAIPSLLRMMRVHDSPLKTKLFTWVSEHSFGKIRYLSPSATKTRAALGFQALGPRAASAVPELIKILDQPRAFVLASHLTIGMPEKDAATYLEQNGLRSSVSAGDSFRWGHFFDLSNGCSLELEIEPKYFRADGLVRGAFIQCYGANLILIPLTNAPGQQ